MRKDNINKVAVGAVLAALIVIGGSAYAKEAGYHFYLAKGLSMEEATSRYGSPLWSDGSKESNNVSLYYHTGFLSTAELRIDKGRVSHVEIYPPD
jgi:hypothetical protein